MAISVSTNTLSVTSCAESHQSGSIHEVGPEHAQSASKRTALNSGNRDTPFLKQFLETQFYACAENQSIDIFRHRRLCSHSKIRGGSLLLSILRKLNYIYY